MTMRFRYSARKSAQAAAFIIQQNGGPIDLIALIKLLYLADRRSLVETGMPITGDKMVNMPLGPVLSYTYDSAKLPREWKENKEWCEYLSDREGNKIALTAEPRLDDLSEYETDLLAETFQKYGRMGTWKLVDFTHKLPEWHDPEGSSTAIDHSEILRSSAVPEERIREILLASEEVYFLCSKEPASDETSEGC